MKKIIIIILIIFITTSCTKYPELNELAIIKSIGIDKKDQYILYAEIINDVKDKEPITEIIKTSADDISTLFNNIKLLVNKEIYFSHIDLIVLNLNLNNNDYDNIIHYFLSHNNFRNDFLTIFSMDIEKLFNNMQYNEIEQLIKTNKESKKIINISFEEIMQKYLDKHEFTLSNIIYQDKIIFNGNYQYQNNHIKEIK